YRGAPLRGADDRRRRPRADQARGRDPERRRPAERVRLPHALPAQDRRDLRAGRAAAARGRVRPSDALPHPDRGAPPAPAGVEGRGACVRIRGAVLWETGGSLDVTELELSPPRAGEVLVRLRASGVCHSDQNAIDGTAEARCPTVL